jgi:hypothetical protein
MSETTIALKPPAELKAAHEKAQGFAAQGREVVAAFTQGVAIDPAKVAELTEAIRAGNARFRMEWQALKTTLPDGREVFTPDFLAARSLLKGTGAQVDGRIRKIDEQGRIVDFDASGLGISQLSPISVLTELQVLCLGANRLEDLTPLSDLTALQNLGLGHNRISNLDALAGLPALRLLDLTGNQIQSLGPLSGLKTLRELHLGGNKIQDLGPLSALAELEELILTANQIEDISPLSGLQRLRGLWLGVNKIQEISPLSDLPLLESVSLGNNPLSAAGAEVLQSLLALGKIKG